MKQQEVIRKLRHDSTIDTNGTPGDNSIGYIFEHE